MPYLRPTHSDRPEDGLPTWKTLRDAIGDMPGIGHHYVQFPDRRLEFFRKLSPGQNWRDLPEDDQRAAMSDAVRDAEGGKCGFYRRLAWDEPCPTLVSMPNMPATDLCHPEALRPLSVEEYRRLQGFPDEWQVCGDLVSQYRQLGNAVPVLLGKAVGLAILEHMRTQRSEDAVPSFRYSRYAGTSDREWCGSPEAARTRLAELVPKIPPCRRGDEGVAVGRAAERPPESPRDGLPSDAGEAVVPEKRHLVGAMGQEGMRPVGAHCAGIHAYRRQLGGAPKAQSSALLSIDRALKWLAQPKETPDPPKDEEHGRAGPGDRAGGEHANDAATDRDREGADAPAPEEPGLEPGHPPAVTPERRRELEAALKDTIRRRDRLAPDGRLRWDEELAKRLQRARDRLCQGRALNEDD